MCLPCLITACKLFACELQPVTYLSCLRHGHGKWRPYWANTQSNNHAPKNLLVWACPQLCHGQRHHTDWTLLSRIPPKQTNKQQNKKQTNHSEWCKFHLVVNSWSSQICMPIFFGIGSSQKLCSCMQCPRICCFVQLTDILHFSLPYPLASQFQPVGYTQFT